MKRTLVITAVAAALVQHLSAQVFDASTQFSPTSNPNSVWRYGFEATTLGSGFTLFNTAAQFIPNAVDSWSSSSLGANPEINHNNTGSTFFASDPALQIEWAANELAFHPGPAGQFSVLRFVAPAAGIFQLAVSFQGIDHQGATTDVHVLANNISLFDQQITGFHVPRSFSTTLTLAQGGTVDFAVGYGANGNFLEDSTGVSATIAVVPEPFGGSLILLGVAIVSVFSRHRANHTKTA